MGILNSITHEVKKLISLESFVSKKYGVSDLLLPVCFVDDGIILNKDGSFSSSFWYSGTDIDSTTDNELAFLNTNVFNSAFAKLGDGWAMHLDLIRKESTGYINDEDCFYSDPTSFMIDYERRHVYNKQNTHYENEFVITFTYLPPSDVTSKAANWFLESDKNKEKVNYEIYLQKFKDIIQQVRSDLSLRIYTTPLNNEEMLKYFHFCINGYNHTFTLPKNGWIDLDYRLASQDILRGFEVKVGANFVGIVSVGDGLPLETYPAILHALSTLEFEYRWSTRYTFLDKVSATKLLNYITDYHYQARESASQMLKNRMGGEGTVRVNRSALTFADQAEDALEKIETAGLNVGKFTCSIVIFDENKASLNEKLKLVQNVLSIVNLNGKIEQANAFDAFLGAIPGMVRNNQRKWIIDTVNLADLMPTTSVWAGYDKNPCRYYATNNPPLFYASTEGNTPFRGCLHVGDIGHTLIMGPSRSGKSVLLNFLATQHFRYKDAKAFIFDLGHSSMPLCYAMNGSHYDIGADDFTLTFKPLEYLNGEDFNFVCQWIAELAEINGMHVTSKDRVDISEILKVIKEEATFEQRTLSYFYHQIKPRNRPLSEAIKQYVHADSSSNNFITRLFNAQEDKLSMSRFTVFELERLSKLGSHVLIPTIKYLFQMIFRQLNGEPTMIILEEAWLIFKTPVMQNMVEEWLRTVAKKNCLIVLCTQQISDILNSDISDVLLDQCATKIFLPNNELINNERGAEAYYKIGLNNKQVDMIANALPRRDYFFSNIIGNRLFSLGLSDVALTLLGKTSMEDLKKAKFLKQKYGEHFAAAWLKEYGLSEAAKFWLTLHENNFNKNTVK